MRFGWVVGVLLCAKVAWAQCAPTEAELGEVRRLILEAQSLPDSQQRYTDAHDRLMALAKTYPRSASIHVRAAGVALQGLHDGKLAVTDYERALALHGQGCALDERDEWLTITGLGLARARLKDFAGAATQFQTALKRWPTDSSSGYNLSCARCRLGDVEGCYRTFVETLITAHRAPPSFMIGHARSAEAYAAMSKRDEDLALLRADKRYEPFVAKFLPDKQK
jgi:tetratricopeptide (TPR) repeat protein